MFFGRKQSGAIGRFPAYFIGFALLMALATVHGWNSQSVAQGIDATPSAPAPGDTLPGTLPGTVPPSLRAEVTIVHAAPFATPVTATAVDVCNSSAQVVDALTGIVYQQSAVLLLDPGVYTWNVAATGSDCAAIIVTLPTLELANSSQVMVIITGDGVNYPIEALVLTLNAGGGNLYFPLILNAS